MHLLHFPTVAGQPATGAGIYGVAFHDGDCIGFTAGSGAVYNAGSGGTNRAHHVAKQGGGTLLAGPVIDQGYNTAV